MKLGGDQVKDVTVWIQPSQSVAHVMDAAVGVLPAGHFLCLAAASWPRVDHSRSHGETRPHHCG